MSLLCTHTYPPIKRGMPPALVELIEGVYLKSVYLKWLSMIMLAWIRYTKAPDFCRGLYERTMVFSSCDSGETRTHGQWLKRPLLYQLSYRVEIDVKFTKNKKIISYNFLNIFI